MTQVAGTIFIMKFTSHEVNLVESHVAQTVIT
jgi:hypothetical protein